MTFENKNLRCGDCKFWWPIAEVSWHEANRERALLGHGQRHPAWATTTRDDWCGEHQHILN